MTRSARRFALIAAALTGALLFGAHLDAAPANPAPVATGAAPPPAPSAPVLAFKSEWIEYRSAHFTALADAAPRRTLDLLRRLERFRQVLSMLYGKGSVDAPVDTLLVVFREPATLQRFSPRYEGRAVEINGVFLARPEGNLILTNGSSQTDPLPTVYHEYMHYFTHNNFPPLPLWFMEGLAECYETFRTDENSAEIGRVKEEHVIFLRDSILVPLDQLFSIGFQSRDYNEGDRRGVFYAESWAITHYLLWDNPERKPQLATFLERLAARQPPVEAFEAAFGTDLGSFMAELRRNIEQNRFHHTIAQFKDQSFEKEVRTRTLGQAEAEARLAEVMIAFDPARAAEAEAILTPALAAQPVPAAAWRALGRVRDAESRPDESIDALTKAAAADPADATAALLLGQALLERPEASSLAAARATLRRALQARPDLAEPAIAFGRALSRTPDAATRSDLDLVIERLERVMGQLPYRPEPAMMLTQFYVERSDAGRGDLARADIFVRKVLPRLTDAATVDEMRHYVESRRAGDEANRAASASPPPEAAAPEDPPPLPPSAGAGRPGEGPPHGSEGASPEGRPLVPDEAEIKRLMTAAPGSLREGEWYLVYNQAAALGNARRYKEALGLLDRLTPGCGVTDVKDQLVELRARLARDAARAGPRPR